MAQVDWDFNTTGGGSVIGGDDGAARLHSALASPLTGEGDYCRDYTPLSSIGVSATLKSTVNGGDFFEMDETKSISIRCWIRATNTGAGNGRTMGFGAKMFGTPPSWAFTAPRISAAGPGSSRWTG